MGDRSGRNERRIVVTGATGTLGREVVAALDTRDGTIVRIVSRGPQPPEMSRRYEWHTTDLRRDDLSPVLADADAVIHLASDKGDGTSDVAATRRLISAAADARVRHLVVVSIIGCDRIPLPFYASKQAIEAAVREGHVPWSIVRMSQFHSFVERLVSTAASLAVPTPIVADLRFQSVDEREAAEVLADVALGPPRGYAPEVAGPAIQTLGEIAAIWLDSTGSRASLVPVTVDELAAAAGADRPIPAAWAMEVLAAYRAADNTPHGQAILGHVGFAEWLRGRSSHRGS